jgi:hypothetical protein
MLTPALPLACNWPASGSNTAAILPVDSPFINPLLSDSEGAAAAACHAVLFFPLRELPYHKQAILEHAMPAKSLETPQEWIMPRL